MRTGIAHLPLHGGKAPAWLFQRMVRLSREILLYLAAEYGSNEIVYRLAHPVWFQSLGCVMGFDWHSSGVTTTTLGALKEGLKGIEAEVGVFICGGKGAASRKTPKEIEARSDQANVLVKISKLTAKVDNTALQDGYQLYHHNFIFSQQGAWAVVQQGMNAATKYARRYHWLSDSVNDFVNEPHAGVACDSKGRPLNLIAAKSQQSRVAITELTHEAPEKVLKEWERLTVLELPKRHEIYDFDINPKYLDKVLLETYEKKPADFESTLLTPGMGPKSLRALTLLAEVLAGAKPAYTDPVSYSFAHGGKDGIPYPVDRKLYDHTIEILGKAVRKARVTPNEREQALRRLSRSVELSNSTVTEFE